MRIRCTTTFLDGRDRFEEDETRVVDETRAQRFIAAGWAVADGAQPSLDGSATSTDLSIQSGTQEQEARHG